MVVDAHVHVYEPSMGDFAWPARGSRFYRPFTPEMLVREAGALVDRFIVIGCSGEFELNRRLLARLRDVPQVGAFVAQLDPADADCGRFVRECAQEKKYRGFRVFSEKAFPLRERLDDMILPGTVVELLGNWRYTGRWEEFAAARPETTFVVEHLGGYEFDGGPTPPEYREFLQRFAALPNTAVKLSGMFTLCRDEARRTDPELYREVCEAALGAFGPGRCMYGSDWPIHGESCEVCVRTARALAGEHAEQVMGETARRIYRLDET